ncbi:MAG: GH92 family glycosyl hydrolase [Cyclobacteriaceae bacterium]
MNQYLLLVLFVLLHTHASSQDPISLVNPFIGTSNYGATNPGAIAPAGMTSVCPFNVAFKKGKENKFEKDSEWHSRSYVHENGFLTGFSHVNLSGVGCPDLGSVILMPTVGELEFDAKKYGSTYKDEEASPGYYSTYLSKYNVKAEVTATERTGLSKYSFPEGKANILLNLGLGLTNEVGASLQITSPTEVVGQKMIGTFCYNSEDVRPVYFVIRFSKPATNYGAFKKMPKYEGVEGEWIGFNDTYKPYEKFQYEIAGDNIGAYFSFDSSEKQEIYAEVGISYVSIANARKNLQAESSAFDFEETRNKTEEKWNLLLSRIEIEGGSQDYQVMFYSALYHLLLHPNIFQDVNGDYPKMEHSGIGNTTENRYTVFSLWDTYRNVHPFLALVYPEIQEGMIRSMLGMYEENGWLPKWELLGMETDVMVGDPAIPTIVDSYLRGLKNFDVKLAYEAMRKSATQLDNNPLRPEIKLYDSLGYIPENPDNSIWGGTVSSNLEYNISDWNLAQMSKVLGKKKDYQYFLNRSLGYKNYFDKSTGMLRPRMMDGTWLEPFNPKAGANFEPVIGFVEGNAWQYRFYVPHDIHGLIKLLGGNQNFIDELQKCFDDENFDMANEPDITYPFLFNQVKGEEWRTQKTVHNLLDKYYKNTPDGIPGNDDTGTLSTWLLFSMLGIYPHCPGDMSYSIVSPSFDRIIIKLNQDYYKGERLEITTKGLSKDNIYIDKLLLNGKEFDEFYIDHKVLTKGGKLDFYLGDSHK